MKFLNYITENEIDIKRRDDVVKILKQDCRPFLEFCNLHKVVFGRETRSKDYPPDHAYVKKYPRHDRKPVDTPSILSSLIDDLFYHKFGWRVRSSGVFTTPRSLLDGIGMQLCFIIGNFNFVTSPKVSDLYLILGDISRKVFFHHSNDIEAIFSQINQEQAIAIANEFKKLYLNTFTEKTIPNETKHGKEVVFDCHSYYLIKPWTFESPEDLKLLFN
jgi:hypothetical protein